MGPTKILYPWDFPDKNTGVGCHSLLQIIFLIQGSHSGLPDCRQILYHLSHQGSPMVYYMILNKFPVLYMSRTSLFFHSIYISLPLQIPNFQSSPPPPSFTLDNRKSVVYVLCEYIDSLSFWLSQLAGGS